jgi:hypothetical protein
MGFLVENVEFAQHFQEVEAGWKEAATKLEIDPRVTVRLVRRAQELVREEDERKRHALPFE